MKTQLTIQELAKEITERAERKEDFIVDTRQITYDPSTNEMQLWNEDTTCQAFKVNDHAHGQIATHTDIPKRYYDRMRSEAPDLLASNIRTWFEKYPSQRMLRALDGKMRAFLSNKFNRMDDDAFAQVVLPAIYDVPGAQIESTAITDLKTHIKFVSERLTREVKRGDVVQFGIAFSNSEVGAGRLTGALFCKQLVCLNGMIIEEEMFASTHVGAKHTKRDLGEIFKLDTVKADGQATILKLRDFSRELLSPQFINAQVERMQGLTEVKVTEPVKAVEKLAKAHSFSEGTKNDVLKHLIEGGDLSLWGLQNAVTRAASDQDDYDEATRMETLGGRMLQLPRAEYKELIAA